jgi:alpha-L-rhamnosidase
VELSGLPAGYTPDLTTITGLYMRSAVDMAGTVAFPDSADVLNQLQRAVSWVMGSNLMSVPSDCPQRDERKG